MSSIKVIIAEDEELFRKGMIELIGDHPEIEVIGEAENGNALMSLLRSGLVPDIILLDLKMPELDGVEATKLIKKEFADIRIIVLTSHYSKLFVANMVRIGVAAFHKKDSSPESIIEAIVEVFRVGYCYDAQTLAVIQQGLLAGKSVRKSRFDEVHLSEREIQVLELICQEKKTAEIAEELFIGVRTVEGHRNNLLLKTSSRNVVGLVLYAVKHNIHKI